MQHDGRKKLSVSAESAALQTAAGWEAVVAELDGLIEAELGTTTLYQVVAPGGYPQIRMVNGRHEFVPDPDDPATAGCMLALLSPECHRVTTGIEDDESWAWWDGGEWHDSATLGRACVAAAEALGRWPGGEE